jgi:hypothetical protein
VSKHFSHLAAELIESERHQLFSHLNLLPALKLALASCKIIKEIDGYCVEERRRHSRLSIKSYAAVNPLNFILFISLGVFILLLLLLLLLLL